MAVRKAPESEKTNSVGPKLYTPIISARLAHEESCMLVNHSFGVVMSNGSQIVST